MSRQRSSVDEVKACEQCFVRRCFEQPVTEGWWAYSTLGRCPCLRCHSELVVDVSGSALRTTTDVVPGSLQATLGVPPDAPDGAVTLEEPIVALA